MNASLLLDDPVAGQLQALTDLVGQLRDEVGQLRSENAQLRRQVRELKCDVGYWKSRHADAVDRNDKRQVKLDLAKAEIRQLKAERFGKQSEKKSGTDRSNDLHDPQELAPPKKKRGQQPGRPAPKRRDYSHLPPREQQVDLPEDAKTCACCGKPLADLGQTEPCEQIEIETILFRRVVRRKRYRQTCQCKNQPRTVTAPPLPKLLPKSIYGTSIWIHLLLEKFHLQRPTHRTIEQFRLQGASLAPGTIAKGLKRIEPLITPIYDSIRDRHNQSKYFHADETRWKVFVEKAGKKGHLWWLWLFAAEDSIVYVLDPSRSHDVPQSHFREAVQGVLMVDRYSAYKAMEQVKEGLLTLAFCWAHVRRDFVKVGKGYPELVPWALQWIRRIGNLYRLNRTRRTHQCKASIRNASPRQLVGT
jgi:transposase